MLDMPRKEIDAINQLYNNNLTIPLQISLQNLQFLDKIGEGLSAEEAIRLAYINPSFETPYKKHVLQAQEYLAWVHARCEKLFIQIQNIKFHQLAEQKKIEMLLQLLHSYMQDKFMRALLEDMTEENLKKEKQIQLEILHDIIKKIEDKIKENNEQIRKNNILIKNLHGEITKLDIEIENKFKEIEKVVNEKFEDINLNRSYELIMEFNEDLSEVIIDEKEVLEAFRMKILDNCKECKKPDEGIAELVEDIFDKLLRKKNAHFSEQEIEKFVQSDKIKNKETISALINDLRDKYKNHIRPSIWKKNEDYNNYIEQRSEKITEAKKAENNNKEMEDENYQLNVLVNNIKYSASININPDIEIPKQKSAFDDLIADMLNEYPITNNVSSSLSDNLDEKNYADTNMELNTKPEKHTDTKSILENLNPNIIEPEIQESSTVVIKGLENKPTSTDDTKPNHKNALKETDATKNHTRKKSLDVHYKPEKRSASLPKTRRTRANKENMPDELAHNRPTKPSR